MNHNQPAPVRTGIRAIDGAGRGVRKALAQSKISNPTLPQDTGTATSRLSRSARIGNAGTRCPYSLSDIQGGYMADSHIARSVDVYYNAITKGGFVLHSKSREALDYIQTRLRLWTIASEHPWQIYIWRAVRDYIKFANAFLVKSHWKSSNPVPGMNLRGLRGKKPVGGYFPASPLTMLPILDDDGKLLGWEQSRPHSNSSKTFTPDDVVHLAHNPESGAIWGVSYILQALDDVRVLRDAEEMIVQLIYKSLNPLIHHEVADSTGTGLGSQDDVDDAARSHDEAAVNGYIITPPNHKIHMLGAESKALRAEQYMKMLKQRVFAGLGLNELIMGEASTSSAGTATQFSAVMYDQIRLYQNELSLYLTHYLFTEWLLEGGFDPLADPDCEVAWRFNDPDPDRRHKVEEHYVLQYTNNAITFDEMRDGLLRGTLQEPEKAGLYLNMVQVPLAQVRFTQPSSDGGDGQQGPTQPVGGGNALKSKAKPSNQHPTNSSESLWLDVEEALAQAVMEDKARPTGADPEEQALLICREHIDYMRDELGVQVEDWLAGLLEEAAKSAAQEASAQETPLQAASRVHGIFEATRVARWNARSSAVAEKQWQSLNS